MFPWCVGKILNRFHSICNGILSARSLTSANFAQKPTVTQKGTSSTAGWALEIVAPKPPKGDGRLDIEWKQFLIPRLELRDLRSVISHTFFEEAFPQRAASLLGL
jgi:hypothetical protein